MIKAQESTGNVFADIGLEDAEKMEVKARLAFKISEIIKHRHMTQTQAAEVLGMPQPKLSGMLRGKFRGISETKMLEYLNRLGRDVQIVVKKARRSNAISRMSVVLS